MDSKKTLDSKRGCDRYDCCFSISGAHLNGTNHFQGKMTNYSRNGLYFKSEMALRPGTSLLILVKENLDADSGFKVREGFRSVALGEVKWCNELGAEGFCHFGIGVQFYEPDY